LEKLTLLVLENDLTVYSSERFIAELEDVLNYPEIASRLTLPASEYVYFHRNLAVVSPVMYAFRGCPDPKDDFLFDLAISANAAYLVTEDKLLLGLGFVRNVKVISLAEFFDLLESRKPFQ
jgi:putative PIN family toxin of toxin-antitoxin system